jgi:hypothetical protein
VSDLIERYAAAERAGRTRIPNRAIEAFGLEWWNTAGYPYHIESMDELWRYHDSMHDGRYECNLDLIGAASTADVVLCERAARVIYEFSGSRFRFASPAKDALSRALYQYQLLSIHLAATPRPWTVLEMGPGSGYLGLLLGLDGHRYLAVEAAQAFFVYQSELWRHAFRADYDDGLRGASDTRVRHVPWWSYNEEGLSLPSLHAITANHALAEMNPLAVQRILWSLKRFGVSSSFLLAESLGHRHHSTGQVIGDVLAAHISVHELGPDLYLMRQAAPGSTATYECHESARRAGLLWRLARSVVARTPALTPLALRVYRRTSALTQRQAKPEPRSTLNSQIRLVFDAYPETHTPDYRYQHGTW